MVKILYYNIDGDLQYETGLLNSQGIKNVELIEVKDKTGDKTFVEYARDMDGIVVGYEQITEKVMQQLPRLKNLVNAEVKNKLLDFTGCE